MSRIDDIGKNPEAFIDQEISHKLAEKEFQELGITFQPDAHFVQDTLAGLAIGEEDLIRKGTVLELATGRLGMAGIVEYGSSDVWHTICALAHQYLKLTAEFST